MRITWGRAHLNTKRIAGGSEPLIPIDVLARAWRDTKFRETLQENGANLPENPIGELRLSGHGEVGPEMLAGTIAASCSTIAASCSTVAASCSTIAASCSTISSNCSTIAATCSTVSAKCSTVASTCSTIAAKCSTIASSCSTIASSCSTIAADCGGRRRRR